MIKRSAVRLLNLPEQTRILHTYFELSVVRRTRAPLTPCTRLLRDEGGINGQEGGRAEDKAGSEGSPQSLGKEAGLTGSAERTATF